MFTALLSMGVERIYWYLLRDYQNFTGMGLLRGPASGFGRYAPNPAYAAYANLIRQLHKASFIRRERTDPRTHVYLFDRANVEVRVAWSTASPARLRLQADDALVVLDIMGRQSMRVPAGGLADLVVDDSPVYIVGAARRIAEAGRDEILADSVGDYSDQQGEAGWYYGYYDGSDQSGGTNPDIYTDDFEFLARVADRWGRSWGDPHHPHLAIGPQSAHPSRSADRSVWAVRRWVSDVSGTVRLSGRIANDGKKKGDGVTAHILIDGRSVFTAQVGGAGQPRSMAYQVDVLLNNGSLVDFALTPGPHHNVNFDSSTFEARITRDRRQ
jgi:hypothetical protein